MFFPFDDALFCNFVAWTCHDRFKSFQNRFQLAHLPCGHAAAAKDFRFPKPFVKGSMFCPTGTRGGKKLNTDAPFPTNIYTVITKTKIKTKTSGVTKKTCAGGLVILID